MRSGQWLTLEFCNREPIRPSCPENAPRENPGGAPVKFQNNNFERFGGFTLMLNLEIRRSAAETSIMHFHPSVTGSFNINNLNMNVNL